MKAKELFEVLDAGIKGAEERPAQGLQPGQEESITVRADKMPPGIGVRPSTVPDPSETTPKSAKLYIFTLSQAKKARTAMRKRKGGKKK